MQKLTDAEMGQIALAYVRDQLRDNGIRLGRNTKRDILNRAKRLGVPNTKAMAFAEQLVREAVEEVFGGPAVQDDEPMPEGYDDLPLPTRE